MAQAKEMLDELKDQAPEADPFPTIRESLAELGANPEKYEKILAKTDEKLHWEKVFNPKTTLEAGAITLLAAAKQSGAEPEEYLSRLAPYFDSRIQSLPGLYNVAGYVSGGNPTRAIMTRTAREIKGSGYTLPHELEHTLQNKDFDSRYQKGKDAIAASGEQFGIHTYMDNVSVPGRPNPVRRFGGMDSLKGDLQKRLSELPEEERKLITAKHPVFGDYLSSGTELFARIRAKDMVDSAKGEDFLQTDLGQKLFPTDRDRSYFIGSTLPGVPKISPPYTFESTEQKKKPLTDPNTSYARQLYNKLTAPKEFAEGGEVTEFPEEQASPTQQDLSEAAKRLLYYKKTASPKLPPGVIPDTGQLDGVYQAPTVTSETSRVFGMQPRGDRLTLLPKFVPGEGLVAPEMLYDAARAIAAPGAAAQGADVQVPDAVNMAFNFTGAGVGTSAAMKKPTGTGGKDISMSTLPSGSTAKDDLAKMPKKLAPANESGFYSPTEAAALNLQRKSGTGQAFLNDLMKGENVKSDEISAMGLDTFLKDKKNVTTAEVQDFIAQNKMKLGETRYGRPKEDPVGMAKRKEVFDKYDPQIKSLYAEIVSMPLYMKAGDRSIANPRLIRMENDLNDLQLKRDAEADAVYKIPENKDTKFQGYALPGGQNYREIVLTLPDPKDALMSQVKALGITKDKDKITVNDILQRGGSDELADNWLKSSQDVYKTRHWDEPNALSHLRVSDRVTDGKKTLLIDEVQSDWHQVARDLRTEEVDDLVKSGMSKQEAQASVPKNFGYKSGSKPLDWNDPEYVKARSDAANALNAFNAASGNRALQATLRAELDRASLVEFNLVNQANKFHRAVPDAPYKDDWYQLTLRRAIKEAVDGGYDRVALPTGARVAERFNLVKKIDNVALFMDELRAYDKAGNTLFRKTTDGGKDLSKILGEKNAERLLKSGPEGEVRYLGGLDIKTGGEGMAKYYDEIYPTYLQKFGKKYGAESGKTTVDVRGNSEPLFYMDITPKMREEFTSGIPMREGGEVRRYL
jgi:hypothetical protein